MEHALDGGRERKANSTLARSCLATQGGMLLLLWSLLTILFLSYTVSIEGKLRAT